MMFVWKPDSADSVYHRLRVPYPNRA
ncbi:hypothetical protein PENNAL_c0999G04130, partial [Penicillium nalgiovense]